jgi:F-type H+/Na+-transporting ATPase subunit alpha
MAYEILEKIKKAVEQYEDNVKWEEIGRVIEVGDGIIKLSGLNNVQSQEVISVETKEGEVEAVALNLEEDSVGALILGDSSAVRSGQTCKRTGKILSISAGKQLLGRVIDPLGNPLDGKGPIFSKTDKPANCFLENEAPNVLSREQVNVPLHTGIKAIDSMIPIGRGQRELIIGDRQTGKTAIALDIIINQLQENKKNPPVCIYVAIGQKESKIAKIVETLKKHGTFDYTIVVSASASSSASFWYLAPFAGCAVGEYFRDNGQDAVIIYDDLSKHAWAYRQISLLLRRPPGREAYPGDIFYLHSRLLERSARLSADKGGGSLTALPIVETQLGDVTAYIPTNVISITDGQIYLESDLFYQGIRPAINIGLSVSRVGSTAQTKAMKKVAGKLRLELAQFRELQRFVQFSSDIDETTKKRICKGRIITEVLKQTDLTPLSFEKQITVLYAALNGYFDAINPEEMVKIEADFLAYMENFHKNILESIKEKKQLDDSLEKELQAVIKSFIEKLK